MTITWKDASPKAERMEPQKFWLVEFNIWTADDVLVHKDRVKQEAPVRNFDKVRTFMLISRSSKNKAMVKTTLDSVNINWHTMTIVVDWVMD